MNKVLLISFFNSTNIGDNAICETLQKEFNKIFNVSVMDIAGKGIPSRKKSVATNSVVTKKCRFYNLKSFVSLRKNGRLDYAKKCIDENDLIVIAGGNLIMDLEHFSYYSFLTEKYIKYAKKKNKKTAILFVGCGRIRHAIQKARWRNALNSCDYISVRDSISQSRLLSELKVKKTVYLWQDPVFLLDNSRDCTRRNQRIAINVYLDATKEADKREQLKQLYLFLASEMSKHFEVLLFSTEQIDMCGLHEVYNCLSENKSVNVVCPVSLTELIELYKTVDIVIATRMHSFIIAITQNIPSLALSWDAKIDGVCSDIGLSEHVFKIENAYENKDIIAKKVTDIANNYSKQCDVVQQINRKNFTMLNKCMDTVKMILEESK